MKSKGKTRAASIAATATATRARGAAMAAKARKARTRATKTTTVVSSSERNDQAYDQLERLVAANIVRIEGPVFTTDVDPDALWAAYLSGIPADRRQHYTCNCCRRFIQQYGGLVTIYAHGYQQSAIWPPSDMVPEFFRKSVAAMERLIAKASVTGVFFSSDATWGRVEEGGWSHLAGRNPMLFHSVVKSADQAMAEKREECRMLSRAAVEFPSHIVKKAVGILTADGALHGREKTLGVAEWLLKLHEQGEAARSVRAARNIIWLAVATAPAGYCHVRSSMIGTLLEDLVAGLPFDAIKRRWDEKMNPLKYMRPIAPPKAGAIVSAERLVEQLGLARALQRRYATLRDLHETQWFPGRVVSPAAAAGVFGHLHQRPAATPINLPNINITWEKFRRTVLPTAVSMDAMMPSGNASFYGLLTATDPDAPPILQWDGLDGWPRNPVSWYVYGSGSRAESWGLRPGVWAKVTSVFLSPHQWQCPERFKHHRLKAFFSLEGARDQHMAHLCLFPEFLRAELHPVRSVIEAHSRRAKGPTGQATGNVNGISFESQHSTPLTVRVRKADGGTATYTLDRWD